MQADKRIEKKVTKKILFFSDTSMWNQYKVVRLSIFLCKILAISCKVSITAVIFIKTTNELTLNYIMCRKN